LQELQNNISKNGIALYSIIRYKKISENLGLNFLKGREKTFESANRKNANPVP